LTGVTLTWTVDAGGFARDGLLGEEDPISDAELRVLLEDPGFRSSIVMQDRGTPPLRSL
jgi:hypothetical protein